MNAVINVDAGINTPVSSFHGRIELNGVNCIQAPTGVTPWPDSVWGCDGAVGAARIFAAGNSLNATLKNRLSTDLAALTPENPKVEIYGFTDKDKFNAFFDTVATGTAVGLSLESIRVSAVLDGGSEASGLHELGHQLEYIWNNAALNDAQFQTAYVNDIATLNALPCNVAFPPNLQGECGTGINNFQILVNLNTQFDELNEAFAEMFQHANPQFDDGPDFFHVFDNMIEMKLYMQSRIANPPPAQQ